MPTCTFHRDGTGPRCCIESEDGTHAGPHLFKCAGASCPGLTWPASEVPHPATCNAVPTTRKPLSLSGWYEHLDGSWGFYSWSIADGLVSLELVTTVASSLDITGPAPDRLRAMREELEASGDRQGASWCTLALHGHDVAIAQAIEIDRALRGSVKATP